MAKVNYCICKPSVAPQPQDNVVESRYNSFEEVSRADTVADEDLVLKEAEIVAVIARRGTLVYRRVPPSRLGRPALSRSTSSART